MPGQWMMEGIGFYCGLTMRWFRDAFCQSEKEEARRHGRDAILGDGGAGRAGACGLERGHGSLLEPDELEEVGARVSVLHAVRRRQTLTSSGKKECIRAIEESAAYVALGHLRIIESITRHRPEEVMLTGGASKGKPVAPDSRRRPGGDKSAYPS